MEERTNAKALLKLPRTQVVLGIFEGSGSTRGYGKDETREALFAFHVEPSLLPLCFWSFPMILNTETTNVASGYEAVTKADHLYRHYRFLYAKTTVKLITTITKFSNLSSYQLP